MPKDYYLKIVGGELKLIPVRKCMKEYKKRQLKTGKPTKEYDEIVFDKKRK